jgi:molybdopterin-guanine dinucleotide biosynthesis protein A
MQSKSASIIVLTGGTSERFGSDKSQALINGKTLIARILESIPSEFEVIIVGQDPHIESSTYVCVQEEPLGGGPVAGFKAGLQICESEIALLIATDMPFAIAKAINLLNSMKPHDEALMYVDAEGFQQPLAALYRVEAVERAFAAMGDVHGKSMRALVSHLTVVQIPSTTEVAGSLIDIDTVADLDRAIAFAAELKDNL